MLITAVTMKIENYENWKLLFDQFNQARKSLGSSGGRILKDASGQNIQVIIHWTDPEKARKFHESAGLQNAMKDAGMVGSAEVRFYYQEETVDF